MPEIQELMAHPRVIEVLDQASFTENAITTLEKRYLLRDASGNFRETVPELFVRVAWNISEAELRNGESPEHRFEVFLKFLEIMIRREFMPNSPTLFNAGTPSQMLSACFVLKIDDSIEDIYTTLKHTAHVHRAGGGTGFSFSNLRESGAFVSTTSGTASGPIDFLRLYDASTNAVKQGGKR